MNTFGQYFKVSIFGESHGPAIGVVLDGVPENIPLAEAAAPDRQRGETRQNQHLLAHLVCH